MSRLEGDLNRKSIFDNPRELLADKLLRKVSEENGNRLFAKVRMADLVDGDVLNTLGESYSRYMRQAHFDFVLVDDEGFPLLAVELDGRSHSVDRTTQWRDEAKNQLCKLSGISLVRINNDFTRHEGKYDLLSYVCEVFFRGLSFSLAQDSGEIPEHEVFDHGSFIERHDDGYYFGTLDALARVELLKLYEGKKIANFCPDIWTGESEQSGDVRADAYLGVAVDRVLVGSAVVRGFGFYGFSGQELASEVAVLELRNQTDAWLRSEPVALSHKEFGKWFTRFADYQNLMRTSSADRPIDRGGIAYPETPQAKWW